MPEMQERPKRLWPLVFVVGLLMGIGIGYGLFAWHAQSAKALVPVPAPMIASQPPPQDEPSAVPEGQRPPRGEQGLGADERRNRLQGRMQAFMDQLPPEQRARAEEFRQQLRQNAADWQNLTPEERQQRMADIATNKLGMTPEAFQRLQSRFNLTPEQQERWRQRMQEMRDRNRTPR